MTQKRGEDESTTLSFKKLAALRPASVIKDRMLVEYDFIKKRQQ